MITIQGLLTVNTSPKFACISGYLVENQIKCFLVLSLSESMLTDRRRQLFKKVEPSILGTSPTIGARRVDFRKLTSAHITMLSPGLTSKYLDNRLKAISEALPMKV